MALAMPALADGRADWVAYAWQSYDPDTCLEPKSADGLCLVHHQKWDWKRNQWVDVWMGLTARHDLAVRLKLTNNDRKDDDHVCVTGLVVDAQGMNLLVFHRNWHSLPQDGMEERFEIAADPGIWPRAARIFIGSKQCRKGEHEDDAVFDRVSAAIGRR